MNTAAVDEPRALTHSDILDMLDSLDLLEVHVECRLNGRVRDLRLIYRHGGLVLRGHTHTYYSHQLAEQFVRDASNLPIVANEIDVL